MIAPAYFLGLQERPPMIQRDGERTLTIPRPPIELWNLTEDIPHHTQGSTVARETLERAGYELPERRPE